MILYPVAVSTMYPEGPIEHCYVVITDYRNQSNCAYTSMECEVLLDLLTWSTSSEKDSRCDAAGLYCTMRQITVARVDR